MRSSTSAYAVSFLFPQRVSPFMMSCRDAGCRVEARNVTVLVAQACVGNVTTAVRVVSSPN